MVALVLGRRGSARGHDPYPRDAPFVWQALGPDQGMAQASRIDGWAFSATRVSPMKLLWRYPA
ncbi:MAG: hypothetical protein ACO35Q_08075, partial [Prochlorothrix sp.]